jgi:hypothetical protein
MPTNNNKWVVHCKKESFDVYIGRLPKGKLSVWGNPFEIGIDGTREQVIAKHRKWLLSDNESKFTRFEFSNKELMHKIPTELKGKILGCWCSPLPCHGDTLAELANGEEGEGEKNIT